VTERVSVLVIGASVATGALITQLRADGHAGRILVVDRDPDMPYDRPPLSKEFLADDIARPKAAWWCDKCELVVGTAEGFDSAARVATIRQADGSFLRIAADHVVIATGSQPLLLPGQPDGVAVLRTAADARRLRRYATPGRRAIVLGAGTIGTELASSLTAAGADVALVDLAQRPLDRFLGGHLGDETTAWICDGGVDLHLGTRVAGIRSFGSGWEVETESGKLSGDIVVSAVGTRPATGWLEASGLALDGGVLCDADGKVLSQSGPAAAGVHAIGDAAIWASEDGGRRRREDWTSAQRQGRHVARRLLGLQPLVPFDAEHDYFWSNQFGRRIQVLGAPERDGVLVQQIEDTERKAAFYTVEHRGDTVAWISVNRPREFALAMRQSLLSAS
jgi:3-phenylpropionate/trans-cinnamate dioxygenase ferredoxin reductase subunit